MWTYPGRGEVLAGLPMSRAADGRLVLVVDLSDWLRPDVPTSADRLFRPEPGRPLGSKNRRPASCYDVGKTVKRPESIIERNLFGPERT